jgi:prepilin-type N-terminal cleavage/methylation domain-containing protein
MDTLKAVATPSRLKGFTIVELLVVIVVIAILAAIITVGYNGIIRNTHRSTLMSDLRSSATVLELDHVKGSYPASAAEAQGGKGLSSSDGVTLTYNVSLDKNTYCLRATGHNLSYFITNTSSLPQAGLCTGSVGVVGDEEYDDEGGGESEPPVAITCPTNFIIVPGNAAFGTSDFCVMKYEAKYGGNGSNGGIPVSLAAGTPWKEISQNDAIALSPNACTGCHLITEAEWMTIAANVLSVPSNWSSGTVGTGYIYSGHNDGSPNNTLAAGASDSNGYVGTGNTSGNQRRTLTLTNGAVIWDLAGNISEWTAGVIAGGAQPGLSSDSSYTPKEWTNSSLQWGGFPLKSRPSAISSQAATWGSSRGVGALNSNRSDGSPSSYVRSGDLGDGAFAGVLTLTLTEGANTGRTWIGFRVAQ